MISKNKLIRNTLELSRGSKRLIAISIDIFICLFTVWFAFYLRLGIWFNLFQDYLTQDLIIKSKYAAIVSIVVEFVAVAIDVLFVGIVGIVVGAIVVVIDMVVVDFVIVVAIVEQLRKVHF